jgi:hypothetical protein
MTDVAIPEKDLNTPAERMLQAARDLTIDGPQMLQVAADELGTVKAKIAALTEERMTLTRPLDQSKKLIMAKYAVPIGYLEQAQSAIEGAVRTYNAEQRRLREEAERKAREAAEAERRRLEAEATRAREKAEAEAAALRERAAAAEAEGRAAEAARLAARAESKVETAELRADAIEQAAAAIPTAITMPAAPKAAGMSSAFLYSAECTSIAELVQFVASNPMYLGLLMVNGPALNAQAKALKDQFAIPGCKLIKTESLRSRAA